MTLRNAILPLAMLAVVTACGDGAGSPASPTSRAASSAGGTFSIEISGAESRTLTHRDATAHVSWIAPDDPQILSFRILEPEGDGYMLYQLMLELSDTRPGEYVFDYETDEFGDRVEEEGRHLGISYTVLEADADKAMVMGGKGSQYHWGQSGTLTLRSTSDARLSGQIDATIHSTRRDGPDRATVRATGEFSDISIARR